MYYVVELPFRAPFSIQTDWADAYTLLRLELGDFVHPTDRPYPQNIRITTGEDGFFFAYADIVFPAKDVLMTLGTLIYDHIPFDSAVLPFHGAALEYGGKAYLFLAPTTGGKTTLAAYLVHRGCGYLSDDCILLDRTENLVYPSATPVHLREGGHHILQELNALDMPCIALSEGCSRRFVFSPENTVRNAVPLGGIYHICRTEDRNETERFTTAERMKALFSSQLVYRKTDSTSIRRIASLAQGPCCFLYYSDMEYVYNVIVHERI